MYVCNAALKVWFHCHWFSVGTRCATLSPCYLQYLKSYLLLFLVF